MRLRALLGATVLVVTGTACSSSEPVRLDSRGLGAAVLAFVAAQQEDRSAYERPSDSAARDLSRSVLALGTGDRDGAEELAAAHAYEVVELSSGRLALAPQVLPDDRGWGLYVVDPTGADLAVEVPHPRADQDTERLGAELVEQVGARYLLVAGAFRRAADGADVAREPDAVFSLVHRALAEAGVPAVQLHGYAEDSLPTVDLIPSPGAADLSPLVRRIADAAEDEGFAVCRPWREDCGQLEGRRNVQGLASAGAGAVFVHLELTRDLRLPAGRERVVRLLDEVLPR